MKNIAWLFGCIFLVIACNRFVYSDIPGNYTLTTNESDTNLFLYEDGNFAFKQNNLGVIRHCEGIWILKSNNRLLINCKDQCQDINKVLSSGFMNSFKKEIHFLNKNKIKIDNIVLKRKKN